MRRHLLGLLLLAICARPAFASIPLSRPQVLLLQATSEAELRAKLGAFADSAARAKEGSETRSAAGEAAYWRGVSWTRAGQVDSAIVAFRRANALRGSTDDALALADALLRRGTKDDGLEARTVAADAPRLSAADGPRFALRRAWALHVAGRADSGLIVMNSLPRATHSPLWTRRLATMALEDHLPEVAWSLSWPLVLESGGADAEAASLEALSIRALALGDSSVRSFLDRRRAPRIAQEAADVERLHARPDSVALAGGTAHVWIVSPPSRTPGVPILLALAPEESLGVADSVAAQLVRAGHPVVLWGPRGSFAFHTAATPDRDAWIGHEDALRSASAEDARRIQSDLARRGVIPGGPWIAAAAGASAGIAIEVASAAKHDLAAVLLIAPRPDLAERGPLRARLAASRVRTFVQTCAEEFASFEFGDALSTACAPRQVRVADSTEPGRGVAVLREDGKAIPRFAAWLLERSTP